MQQLFAMQMQQQFLSTPSARRATQQHPQAVRRRYISIHALREEGDERRGKSPGVFLYFYPRPPRGGRPKSAYVACDFGTQFLSTPSARRATAAFYIPVVQVMISIHALREEGDLPAPLCGFPNLA